MSRDGEYYNFFWTPDSVNSLHRLVEEGWHVKFIKDDPDRHQAVVVFEKVEDFVCATDRVYCRGCGYVYVGITLPATCNNCGVNL